MSRFGTTTRRDPRPLSGGMRARVVGSLLLVLLAALPAAPRAEPPLLAPSVRAAMSALSTDSIFRRLDRLAGDEWRGRATGTPGCDSAAAYIAAELRRSGLEPLGDDGSYFQRVPMHGSRPLPGSRFTVTRPDSTLPLALDRDYLLYTTGAYTLVPKPVPLVFVGYGIVAPEYDYNDYQTVDVDGAIVVFLEGEPVSDDPDYFDGPLPTIYSFAEMKQRIAISRGAVGSILVPSERVSPSKTWDDWRAEFAFEHVTLLYDVPRALNAVVRPETARLLFRGGWFGFDDVLVMDRRGTMRSFPLDARAMFDGAFTEREFLASNVIGVLRGRGPILADTYVVASAHYDHLGVGPPVAGDSIYNGAVDNALGVAALLEIARVLAAADERPLRSIVFLFPVGEEKGLLGSRHYCAHPPAPLSATIANVNVDGLAVFDTFRNIVGVGAGLSTIGDHLARVADELGLVVSPIPSEFLATDAFARSDQLAFAQAGVPSILVAEGLDYRHLPADEGLAAFLAWGETRYHTPFDDAAQPIDAGAVLEHAEFLVAFLETLADTYTPPQWIPGSAYVHARLRSMAEKR